MRRTFLVAVVSCLSLQISVAAASAEPRQKEDPAREDAGFAEPGNRQADPAERDGPSPADGPYGPGQTDVILTTSILGFPYLAAQPAIELGLVGFEGGVTLSAGGELDAGWCGLCALAGLAPGIDRIRSSYVSPRARLAVHLNRLGSALGSDALDVYFGAVAGPAYYSLTMATSAEPRVESTIRTVIFGPMVGFRATPGGERGFFVTGEGRLHTEFGRQVVSVSAGDDEDEDVILEGAASVGRTGIDTIFGIGYRF